MERRSFIRILGIGMATATLTSTLSSCSAEVDYGWDGPTESESDIRLQVLAYAILSANPHNIQPWLIKFNAPQSFDLFVDQNRLLPQTDPFARQIHIGQGTFLETAAIAATAYGYQADIAYFPQGEYRNTVTENLPVARVVLNKKQNIKVDPLFAQLLKRQSNKREYDNSRLSQAQKSQLQELATTTTSSFTLVDSEPEAQYLQQVLTQAMAIEAGDKARDLETIKMFRFNDQEVQKFRDGFGLAHAGVTGIRKFMAESFFLDRQQTENDTTEFANQSVDISRSVSDSTSSFAWLTTKGNSRLQQVKVGRDYCRLNLTTTAMGLAQHPMSQVLEEYEEMLELQQQFKQHFNIDEQHTVQMLVRLGKAEKTEHTPRRLVSSLMLT